MEVGWSCMRHTSVSVFLAFMWTQCWRRKQQRGLGENPDHSHAGSTSPFLITIHSRSSFPLLQRVFKVMSHLALICLSHLTCLPARTPGHHLWGCLVKNNSFTGTRYPSNVSFHKVSKVVVPPPPPFLRLSILSRESEAASLKTKKQEKGKWISDETMSWNRGFSVFLLNTTLLSKAMFIALA